MANDDFIPDDEFVADAPAPAAPEASTPASPSHSLVPSSLTDVADKAGNILTGLPVKQLREAGANALGDLWESHKKRAEQADPTSFLSLPADIGHAVGTATAPLTEPFEKLTKTVASPLTEGMTYGIQGLGEPIAKSLNPNAKLPSHDEVYGKVEPEVLTALGLMKPGDMPWLGRANAVKAPRPVPTAPPNPEFGITISKGQETGNIADIRREAAAGRGQYGPEAEARANAFLEQQREQIAANRNNMVDPLDAADTVSGHLRNTALDQQANEAQRGQRLRAEHENLRTGLGYDGRVIAQSPQEAADVIGASVTRAEEEARAARDQAYADFRAQNGFFEPRVFSNVGRDIRSSLNRGDNPVVLNSKTTPISIQALRDVDEVLGAPARAAMDPAVRSFTPFTPSRVDDVRKRLVSFRRQANTAARATGDYSDTRAIGRIMDAFDDVVQRGLRSPNTFSGNGTTVADAMANARGLHSELRSTFSGTPGDKAGRVMQDIVGRGTQSASPNQIRNQLYGTGETPVQVARRLVGMFGEDSPEVSALKQGYFSHITEKPAGVTEWGPEQVADRIYEALNGKGRELSREYLNGNDQARLRAYADRLRASVQPPPPRTDVVSRALDRINGIGGQGATSSELSKTLFGNGGMGENPLGVKLAQHVRDTYGADSEAFSAIRAGMLSRLTEGTPVQVAKKIAEHFNRSGRPMADTLWNGPERDLLQRYGEFMNRLVVPPGSYNPSAPAIVRAINAASGKMGAVIGAVIGRMILPFAPPLVSEGLGAAGAHVAIRTAQKMQARSIARQLPLVSESLARWQRAVAAANRANSPSSATNIATAANALDRALTQLSPSLSLKRIAQDMSRANAGGNKQEENKTEPPVEKKNGGEVQKKPVFRAHGGRVNGDSNPPVTGARLAPDGEWYVPDPYREKKYLRVVARGGTVG